ncbi:MAG: hypothetical protein HYS14_03690 [Candidatus Rokubacteria bacterium]|nr:hypothetical protein [Candidatus Rokubacteria bacterium]
MLRIKLSEGSGQETAQREQEIFSESFLLKRPLLQAITHNGQRPVLLIDEIDRCVSGDTLVATTTGLKLAREVAAGDQVLSFDPSTFRPTTSLVEKVIERETSEVLRVMVGGRALDVTPEHKFARFNDHGFEIVRGDQLRRGDRLPLRKYLEGVGKPELDLSIPDEILKLSRSGKRYLYQAYGASGLTYRELGQKAGISTSHLSNVLGPISTRDSLRAEALSRLCTALGVSFPEVCGRFVRGLRVVVGTALFELFGYIVADGCFTSSRLTIADKDRRNLEIYANKFVQALGARPVIRRGPHRNFELSYWSLPLGRFLQKVLGEGIARSRDRRVPSFVFCLPTEMRAGFLRGYFDGEGWVSDHQVAVSSASLPLLIGIQHLLSSLGIDGQISIVRANPKGFGRGPYYTLSISDVPAFLRKIGFCSLAKRRAAEGIRSPGFRKTETLPRFLVTPILEHIRTNVVLHTIRHHQTVYDVLSGRIRPNADSLWRISEAVDSPGLRLLLDGRIVLGEVSSVERISRSQTVYDLVLNGQPYFVANQVVTHNCDEEFEAFLLEVLSDFQVTIPELGTIRATHRPYVILTSNRFRDLSDALRRRCLYLWIDYPTFEKELRIVRTKVPDMNERLAAQVCRFMQETRRLHLAKVPGIAETLDWALALTSLHQDALDPEIVRETLGCLFKDVDDLTQVKAEALPGLLAAASQSK